MSSGDYSDFYFYVLMSWGPTGANRQNTTHKEHSMISQVDTIDFLSGKDSLRKPPHAFGSESVNKSETEKAC